jgi:aspartyl-tRNA(Asn)/glutamyl-tRNA(Gln) amidotransferase subunit C
MTVDFIKEVDTVARLARLHLSETEKARMAEHLAQILKMARRVQEVDTDDVEPCAHVVSLPTACREDLVKSSLPLSQVLQNAPCREKSFFRVPRIAGEEGES